MSARRHDAGSCRWNLFAHSHTYCWILASILHREATCFSPAPLLTYMSTKNISSHHKQPQQQKAVHVCYSRWDPLQCTIILCSMFFFFFFISLPQSGARWLRADICCLCNFETNIAFFFLFLKFFFCFFSQHW